MQPKTVDRIYFQLYRTLRPDTTLCFILVHKFKKSNKIVPAEVEWLHFHILTGKVKHPLFHLDLWTKFLINYKR